MGIKEEFETAFKAEKSKEVNSACGGRNEEEAELNCALWAARWMAKRLCDYHNPERCSMETPQECKGCLAAKELE